MADERDGAGNEARNIAEGIREGIEGVSKAAEAVRSVAAGETRAEDPKESLAAIRDGYALAGRIAGLAQADPAIRRTFEAGEQLTAIASATYGAVETVGRAIDAIAHALGGDAQHRVEYEFECRAADGVAWRVVEVEVEEGLNRPYRAQILLTTEDSHARPLDLLGADARLRIRRGSETSRSIHGLIARVEHGRRTAHHVSASVELVPALEVLRHVEDSRIFQDVNAPDAIEQLLEPLLQQYDRSLRVEVSGTYLCRELCVQYQESVLAFFDRLCEEEGLTYFFEHSGEHETLVVVDDDTSFVPCYLLPTAADVPFVRRRGGDLGGAEPVYALEATDRLGPTSLTVADCDWTAIELPFSDAQRSRDAQDREREQYQHGLGIVGHYDRDAHRYTGRDARLRAQRGRERQALSTFEYRGQGAVSGFTPGTVFTLSGHPEAELDGEYLLVSVRHRGRDRHAGDADDHGGETRGRTSDAQEYENEFVCIPSAIPHRPPHRTAKPRIASVQTAIVVGPESEEVWTDEHGRVRVQFHWDRLGNDDERSTAWIRVMQSWAGAGFGTMFVPRIGMEVVVGFLDGDPDRPLVTGCVYNGANPPPITLPDDKTQSVIRTQSSPESDGFNELRFEDKAGSERVALHAQRDHATRVRRNQSNVVDGDQTETVGGDQTMTVRGKRNVIVEDDEDVNAKKNHVTTIEENHTEYVYKSQSLNVGERRDVYVGLKDTEVFDGGREVTVAQFDNIRVDANKNTEVSGQYNVAAGEHFKVMQGGETLLLKDEVFIESSSRTQVKSPAARLVLDGGEAKILAAEKISLECGGCKIEIGDGKVAIKAPSIELHGGGALLTLGSGAAQLNAPSMVTIMGGIVSIN